MCVLFLSMMKNKKFAQAKCRFSAPTSSQEAKVLEFYLEKASTVALQAKAHARKTAARLELRWGEG